MNKIQLTLSYLEQIEEQAACCRKDKMISCIESVIAGSDNEIVKSIYQSALKKVKEGWPC